MGFEVADWNPWAKTIWLSNWSLERGNRLEVLRFRDVNFGIEGLFVLEVEGCRDQLAIHG